MDKEIALLHNRINELELENCEAQNKIDQLKKVIDQLGEEVPNKKKRRTKCS
tara:strand:+ start:283 stop:438 length:156 start_codon:yes stop_codon:yes gene_type:complete